MRQLALVADFYLPSVDEFKRLWNVSSTEEGLRKLATMTNGIVVVKNSSEGAMTLINGEIVTTPAFAVNPIHTIGAGDGFNAGVIAAQYKGKTLGESIVFGCATAALRISQSSLPTYDEVEGFINHRTSRSKS